MITLPENIDSKFRFIIIAAERAKQLQGNARPKIATKSTKPTSIAMQEVLLGLVRYEVLKDERPG